MAEKIAILGDSHFPGRAKALPETLLSEIRKFSPDRIVFTGDANSGEVLKKLSSICLRTEAVKGEKDYLEFPSELVFSVEGMRFGVVHGDFVVPAGNRIELENYGKTLRVDVLISGHSHRAFSERGMGIILLNPGSFTGVPLPGESAGNPSLMLATADKGRLSVKLVELSKGKIAQTTEEFVLSGNRF